ncbi:MAG: hypothetical protein AAF502_09500 [Bacteroidota bacterium]
MFSFLNDIPELKTRIIQQLSAIHQEVNPGELFEIIKTLNSKSFVGKVNAKNVPGNDNPPSDAKAS